MVSVQTSALHAFLLLPTLPEPVKEEVIEAAVVPETATTTGDNVANPSYTAQLDALATGIYNLTYTASSLPSVCYIP